ncbi:phosphotransferase [Kosakonia sp. BK9b]
MSVKDLARMGAASVERLMDETGHSVIEKGPVGEVEYAFYQHAAHELALAGVTAPELLSADPHIRKLRLEYIPHPVDQTAAAGDDILLMLGRLHDYPARPEWRYHPHSWSACALEKSLALLALPHHAAQQLRHFQRCSNVLFFQTCLISGDSNAGNWGRRDNGDLVLFDWERFGTGSPAIDLAPLIKGMGTQQAFIDLAERYQRLSSRSPSKTLARDIAIAKAWVVTEVVILLHERQKAELPFYLDWYRNHLPGWLENSVNLL